MRRPSFGLVATLLFGSGLTALLYQTAWQRMLRLIFGASTAASAAVLAIFLGGLGLGGAWLGRRAEKKGRPLLFYGNLEVAIAVGAALTPLLCDAAARVYFALGGSPRMGTLAATAVRLVLAALVIGPPAVLMGGTLPAAARAVETHEDRARVRLSVLYATNTLGAVVGALAGTFLLFELFGTRLALYAAALLNLLVAVVARSAGRSADALPVRPDEESDPVGGPRGEATIRRPAWLAYGAAGVVGFVFVALELVWYRILAPVLGGSSYTFGLVLACALAGIGVGGGLYALRPRSRPATVELLAATAALEAVAVAVPLAIGDPIALFAAYTRGLAAMGFSALVLSWTLVTLAVVFPAAVVAGYQFPVLIGLLGEGRTQVARQVGLAYAANTLGSILGALAAGFVLFPWLGVVATWRVLTVVLLLLALVCVGVSVPGRWRRVGARGGLAVALSVIAVLCAGAAGPTAVWRHTPIGAGRLSVAGLDRNGLEKMRRERQHAILWERDGVESSVGLGVTNGVSFIVNGKSDGSVTVDRGTQAMAGVLPALLHGSPKEVFVVGLGTGMSAGWVAAVPSVERVDVAELEPAIAEVARAAAAANADVLESPNVHIFFGDGREFLLTTRRRYDIIVSEPSNPYRAGVASLFTREYYEAALERLNRGGFFIQWMQGYEIDVHTLRIVLRTITDVFPFVELWHTQADDLLFVASDGPRSYDVEGMRGRARTAPYSDILPRAWMVEDVEGVFAHFLASDVLVRQLAAADGVALNTDDDTVLEYAFARQVGTRQGGLSARLLSTGLSRGQARPAVRGAVDWDRVHELRSRPWLEPGGAAPALPGLTDAQRARIAAIGVVCAGSPRDALRIWQQQEREEPVDVVEVYVLAEAHATAGNAEALELASRLEAKGFAVEAALVRGRYLAGKEEDAAAFSALSTAVGELRSQALPLCDAARLTLDRLHALGRRRKELAAPAAELLLAAPFGAYIEEGNRLLRAQELAFMSEDPEVCVRALGAQLTRAWWNENFLRERYLCLTRAGHPLAEAAADDLVVFLAQTMGDIGAGLPAVPVAAP